MHQSRDNVKNYGCHRLQVLRERIEAINEHKERQERVKRVKLTNDHPNVSMGPHKKGSPINADEKRCILNLYQSYLDDGISCSEAREETARRLQFGHGSVTQIIKEMLSEGNVVDNKQNMRENANAFEKLTDEEENIIRHVVHDEFRKCDVKRLVEDEELATYPTVGSVYKAVMDTELFPNWSISTFRSILLGMNIKFQAKSEVDRAILIEDERIINWRDGYLDKIDRFRRLGKKVYYMDETYMDPNAQMKRLLTDNTILSAKDAEARGLTTGLKWNAGRGNRLLIIHMIGPDGFVNNALRVWIRTGNTPQSEDYHNDLTFEDILKWLLEILDELPEGSVIAIDNASIHNKRPKGTPNSKSKKAELIAWLDEKNIYYKPGATRPQLWELVKRELDLNPEYSIDKIINKIRPDIIFLRIPPYHCELNPIELI